MSYRVLQRRDLDLLFDNVCLVTPLQQMNQLVYFLYGSLALYLYIQETHGEVHQQSLSMSILFIFATDFSIQNGFTTTIPTKNHKTAEFSILFVRQMTLQSQSSFTIQYLFESMFMCYSLQKKKGVAQQLLFGEKISGNVTSDLSNTSLKSQKFVFVFVWFLDCHFFLVCCLFVFTFFFCGFDFIVLLTNTARHIIKILMI